jgi:hypothetical protein
MLKSLFIYLYIDRYMRASRTKSQTLFPFMCISCFTETEGERANCLAEKGKILVSEVMLLRSPD